MDIHEFEADTAEFDEALEEMGASERQRSDLRDQWRVLSGIPKNSPSWQPTSLALVLGFAEVVEGDMRRGGAHESADMVARLIETVRLFNELPDELRAASGLPSVD